MDNSHNVTALVLSYVFDRPTDDMVAAEAAVFRRLRETVAHLPDGTPDVVRGVVGDRAETIVDVVFALFVLFYAPFTYGQLVEHIDEMGPDGEELAYVKREIGGLSADPDALIPVKGRVFSQAFLVASIRHHTKRSNEVMRSKPMIERCLQFLDAAGLLSRSERRGGYGLDVTPKPGFRELVGGAILDVEATHHGPWRRFRHLRGSGLAVIATLLIFMIPLDADAAATEQSWELVIEDVETAPLAAEAWAALEDVGQGYGRLIRRPVEPVKPEEVVSRATDAPVMHLFMTPLDADAAATEQSWELVIEDVETAPLAAEAWAALEDVGQGYGRLIRRPVEPVKPEEVVSRATDAPVMHLFMTPLDADAAATEQSWELVIEDVETAPLAAEAWAALEDVRQGYGRLIRRPVEPVKPEEVVSWATDAPVMHLVALQDVRQGYGKLVGRPSDPVKPEQTHSYSPGTFGVIPELSDTGVAKRDLWF